MDNQYAFELPLRIVYSPPRWLLPFICSTHASAILCIFTVDAGWITMSALVVSIITSLAQAITRHSGTSTPSRLILDARDRWMIIKPGAGRTYASLLAASVVLPDFIVLLLKTGTNKKYVFILTRENLDQDTLRRLRVRLFFSRS